MVETTDGRFLSGLEVASDADTITLRSNPLDPEELLTLRRTEIHDQATSRLSAMPSGLLVTLSEEEILDLLRFVRSGTVDQQP